MAQMRRKIDVNLLMGTFEQQVLEVKTLEGDMIMSDGDW